MNRITDSANESFGKKERVLKVSHELFSGKLRKGKNMKTPYSFSGS
jgi:hypothetical protein